ncbi:acyltransferase [Actinoplanes sp. NEAU-A12]|uniref:Acyltransferase n=1 Tax=Actinoplanes sandaracinus TaxID=3045177 RepID=A0ABT6WV06_9ACTN|nr:acyltransferase [Actinoplanes sandaracinus]MDI6103576.1 acyltransferase [Actinoplanes sandaracinus]
MTATVEQRHLPKQPSSATGPPPRRGSRIAVIDGLRLLAALAVAFFHLGGTYIARDAWEGRPSTVFPAFYSVASYGWLGVELFFMISGFVICMSSWGRSPGQFFRSRVVRLFPAFWPAVLISTTVVAFWPVVGTRLPWDQVIVNLTMLNLPLGIPNVDGSYWTLWAEMRFYLLFAVVLLWRGLTMKRTVLFGYGWLVLGVLAKGSKDPLLTLVFQPKYAPFFVAGIAFFLIHRFGSDLQLWGLAGLSWALAMHNAVGRLKAMSSDIKDPTLDPRVAMVVVTLFFVVMAVIAVGWTARIQWRWLTWAGALTYPFYLIHQTVGFSLVHGLHELRPRLLVLAGVIGILLVLAWLLHRLVEKPLARILKTKLEKASLGMREKDAREQTTA